MLTLAGRGAIIAGSRRVGATVAKLLAREGVRLAIVYRRSRSEAESLHAEVEPLVDRSCTIQADLAVENDVARLVEEAKRQLGDLSFSINLASDYHKTPLEVLDNAAWERGMDAARGAFLLNLHAGRAMIANDGPTRGHLISFGDWAAGETPYHDYLPYLTAKAAIHFMVRAFAVELAPHGILVNAILPGPTARPPDASDEEWQAALNRAPLHRESSDAEMAELVVTLLKMETITGENIRVDSGRHLIGTSTKDGDV
jgi:NAD(P)-dependent dehydrogenase (short-subunit alcohol dehydrogenase family)